jgi:hypothetical protein
MGGETPGRLETRHGDCRLGPIGAGLLDGVLPRHFGVARGRTASFQGRFL